MGPIYPGTCRDGSGRGARAIRVRTTDEPIAVVDRLQPLLVVVEDIDVEVVAPEVHHALVELARAVDGAKQRRQPELEDRRLEIFAVGDEDFHRRHRE